MSNRILDKPDLSGLSEKSIKSNESTKIIFLAGVTAMFCACNTKPVGYFCVSGKISDADGREIYLYRTSNNRSAATVDTAVIENGRFIFEGIQETPIGATLMMGDPRNGKNKTRVGLLWNRVKSSFQGLWARISLMLP